MCMIDYPERNISFVVL